MATKTDSNQNDAEPEEILEAELLEPELEKEPVEEEEVKELTPLEQLQEDVRLKDEELLKQKDTFLREKAELENFKKRLTKEKKTLSSLLTNVYLKSWCR